VFAGSRSSADIATVWPHPTGKPPKDVGLLSPFFAEPDEEKAPFCIALRVNGNAGSPKGSDLFAGVQVEWQFQGDGRAVDGPSRHCFAFACLQVSELT